MIDYIWNNTEDIFDIDERCMDNISFEELGYVAYNKFTFRNIGKDKGVGDFIRCSGCYTDPLNFKAEEYSSDSLDGKCTRYLISPFKYRTRDAVLGISDIM